MPESWLTTYQWCYRLCYRPHTDQINLSTITLSLYSVTHIGTPWLTHWCCLSFIGGFNMVVLVCSVTAIHYVEPFTNHFCCCDLMSGNSVLVDWQFNYNNNNNNSPSEDFLQTTLTRQITTTKLFPLLGSNHLPILFFIVLQKTSLASMPVARTWQAKDSYVKG